MLPSTLGWSILFAYLVYPCIPFSEEPQTEKQTVRELLGRNYQTIILSALWVLLLLLLPTFSCLKEFDHKPGSLEDHV